VSTCKHCKNLHLIADNEKQLDYPEFHEFGSKVEDLLAAKGERVQRLRCVLLCYCVICRMCYCVIVLYVVCVIVFYCQSPMLILNWCILFSYSLLFSYSHILCHMSYVICHMLLICSYAPMLLCTYAHMLICYNT
jgi:hypothetical protein